MIVRGAGLAWRHRQNPFDGPAGRRTITEVEGSHVIMISQPQAVTDVIVTAARAVAGSPR